MFLRYSDLTTAEEATYSLYKTNGPFEQSPAFAYSLTDFFLQKQILTGPWAQQVQLLDGMLSRSCLPQDQILYRAMSDAAVLPYLNGQDFSYPGFMSTTTDAFAVHSHFGVRGTPALLIIECSKGTPALDMEMNNQHGNKLEREILLPRNLPLQVESIEIITASSELYSHMGGYFSTRASALKLYKLSTKP
jgi:hypothetical protein